MCVLLEITYCGYDDTFAVPKAHGRQRKANAHQTQSKRDIMAAVSFLSTNGAHRNSTGGDAQANAGQE